LNSDAGKGVGKRVTGMCSTKPGACEVVQAEIKEGREDDDQ
jgi:hypothetical protein